MAALSVFTFDQWNAVQIAGAQAASTDPLDFSIGSNPLAMVEGSTASLLYLQADIIQILALTRASTSVGADLDTWFADFAFARLPATQATGVVQLHRDQATALVTIPADGSALVLLSDGSQAYQIVPDAAQPSYAVGSNNYRAPINTNNILVTVRAINAGVIANAPTGASLLLSTNTAGFDTATIVSGFQNGQPAETDNAFRARFVLFMASLSRGTVPAIQSAIANVQSGIDYTILSAVDPAGNIEPGNILIFIDDGSGNAPDSLLAAVDAAVASYKAATVSHNIRRPQVVNATVSLSIQVAAADPTQFLLSVTAFVGNYINSLKIGQTLSLTRLSAVIYNFSPLVQNVEFVTINGQQADLVATSTQLIRLAPNALIINSLV